MCLLPEHWPNQAGWVNQSGGRVILTIGSRRFSMRDFNTGYCPDCATRVEPGATITSIIPYDRFDLPYELANQPKTLDFSPAAFRCGQDSR